MQAGMETSVKTLNSFLRGEISAVETYRQAIDKVEATPVRSTLEECLRSHQMRVNVLKNRIATLGGDPATDSGPWGTFAKLVEGSAKVFGEKAAVAALEEGEDHGRNDYKRDIDKLDAESRQIVELQVLPEQERTHQELSTLKKTV
jgi:demethoxyubiquinone hydroxylase (CLK1/Coq7/Cat5 family)